MKAQRYTNMSRPSALLKGVRRYQLLIACLVIAMCFALGNDVYRAKAVVLKNKDLFGGNKKVVNFLEAKRSQMFNRIIRGDVSRQYLINPRKAKQSSMLRVFAGGDTCSSTQATPITALPYNDPAGTTVGLADNYDLPSDTATPTLTGCATCTATGAGPVGSLPRGAVYTGTGQGPDSAYRISFGQNNANITVTMDPTAADIALLVYTNVCSNNLSDGIVVDDTGAGGVAESVTITTMPAGAYNIVVDGYLGSSDTYTLAVACVAGQTCIQPSTLTPANVTVSGRILTNDRGGRGLTNAAVQLIDQSGNSRTIITGRNGYFQFDEVVIGQSYTITIGSKRYTYSPRVIEVNDAINDLEITPDQ